MIRIRRQLSASVSTPPSNAPEAPPIAPIAPQSPSARLRSGPSGSSSSGSRASPEPHRAAEALRRAGGDERQLVLREASRSDPARTAGPPANTSRRPSRSAAATEQQEGPTNAAM